MKRKGGLVFTKIGWILLITKGGGVPLVRTSLLSTLSPKGGQLLATCCLVRMATKVGLRPLTPPKANAVTIVLARIAMAEPQGFL